MSPICILLPKEVVIQDIKLTRQSTNCSHKVSHVSGIARRNDVRGFRFLNCAVSVVLSLR